MSDVVGYASFHPANEDGPEEPRSCCDNAIACAVSSVRAVYRARSKA